MTTDISAYVAQRMVEARARIRASTFTPNAPYFMGLIYALTLVEVGRGTLKTFAIDDKLRLYIDPEFLESITLEELAAVLIHEIGHIYQRHKKRADRAIEGLGLRDVQVEGAAGTTVAQLNEDSSEVFYRRLWNIAADAELNDDLRRAGWRLPKFKPPAGPDGVRSPEEDCVYPEALGAAEGLFAEEYFQLLLAAPSKAVMSPECGSGSGGVRLQVEGPPGESPKDSDGSDIKGKSEVEVIAAVKSTAMAVQNHEQKSPGSVPAGLLRQAEEILGPSQVDWRSRLRFAIRNAVVFGPGTGEATYRRLNRKQAGLGYGMGRPVLVGQRRPKPDVWVSIDASGSVSARGLGYALRELDGVLKMVGEVRVSSWDGAAYPPKRVRSVAQAAKQIQGGGGTEIDAALVQMLGAQQRPNVAVIVTDGEVWLREPALLQRLDAKIVVVVVGAQESAHTLERIPGWEVVHVEER